VTADTTPSSSARHNGLVWRISLPAGLRTLLVEARARRRMRRRCRHSVREHLQLRPSRFAPRRSSTNCASPATVFAISTSNRPSSACRGPPVRVAVFHDVERTIGALQLTHPDQTDGYRRYARLRPAAKLIVEAASEPPSRRASPDSPSGETAVWPRCCAGAGARSPTSSVSSSRRVRSSAPPWRAGRRCGACHRTPGSNVSAVARDERRSRGRPAGSGALTGAIRRAFGGRRHRSLRCTGPPVTCEGNRVRGVELDGNTDRRRSRVGVRSAHDVPHRGCEIRRRPP
jgi:hypothetical protein